MNSKKSTNKFSNASFNETPAYKPIDTKNLMYKIPTRSSLPAWCVWGVSVVFIWCLNDVSCSSPKPKWQDEYNGCCFCYCIITRIYCQDQLLSKSFWMFVWTDVTTWGQFITRSSFILLTDKHKHSAVFLQTDLGLKFPIRAGYLWNVPWHVG